MPSIVRRVAEAIRKTIGYNYFVQVMAPLQAHDLRRRILADARHDDPRRLLRHGYRFHSKTDEDGIIAEIFRRIGVTNKLFVELGSADGLENNTSALLHEGWSGVWIEGSPDNHRKVVEGLPDLVAQRRVRPVNAFITPDNIDELIAGQGVEGEIDMMSIDIDGNDIYVFEKLTQVRPRLLVMECNPKFPPQVAFSMPYKADHIWRGTDYMGASLKALELRLAPRGYALVGCNITGGNSFWVREDLLGDHFAGPFTAENHYEPERYFIARAWRHGHTPEHRTLNAAALQ